MYKYHSRLRCNYVSRLELKASFNLNSSKGVPIRLMVECMNEENTMQEMSIEMLKETAKNVFGIEVIFPYQLLVISNILDAEREILNTEEIATKLDATTSPIMTKVSADNNSTYQDYISNRQIVLFPTGAGKSLCFQLPSLFLKMPTLVIYPLLALMRDQYNKLKNIVNTVMFIGGQSEKEREEAYKQLQTAHIIIANPEVLQNKEILQKIKMRGISHLAIDETHCVSEWGDTFRPAYLKISSIIKEIAPLVITAFTATASEPVLKRMQEVIFEGEAHIIQSSLDRPNLHFSVIPCIIKEPILLQEIEKREKPIVVFTSNRKKCEQLSMLIGFTFPQIQTKFYHAGLQREEKKAVETWFQDAKDAVLVATCAYGMGVDKKDIHTVIHFEAPSTIEAYIQEAGRAGRDKSIIAEAILLWNEEDEQRLTSLASCTNENSHERRAITMLKFIKSRECRRHFLLKALSLSCNDAKEEELPACSTCDVCSGKAFFTAKEISHISSYLGINKINRATLIENVNNANKFWNLQYSKKLIFSLEKMKIIVEDRFFWRGKLKLNRKKMPLL